MWFDTRLQCRVERTRRETAAESSWLRLPKSFVMFATVTSMSRRCGHCVEANRFPKTSVPEDVSLRNQKRFSPSPDRTDKVELLNLVFFEKLTIFQTIHFLCGIRTDRTELSANFGGQMSHRKVNPHVRSAQHPFGDRYDIVVFSHSNGRHGDQHPVGQPDRSANLHR